MAALQLEYVKRVIDYFNHNGNATIEDVLALDDICLADGRRISKSTAMSLIDSMNKGATRANIFDITKKELEAVYSLALCLVEKGEMDKSHTLFQYLCIQDHLNSRNWIALGKSQISHNRLMAAISSFEYGSFISDANPVFPLSAAEVYFQLGELSDAESGLAYAQYLSLKSDNQDDFIKLRISRLQSNIARKRESEARS